mmetsp:Transcript_87645/g.253120  ORF Transcript_87645/g.253120 Transcript_87645/m.253120 type:complete len:388 (+) Transcript_87645:72-1235(+)
MAEPEACDGSAAPPASPMRGGDPELKRIHLLPIGELDEARASANRLDLLAGTLRQRRSEGVPVSSGDILRDGDLAFTVIKCDPNEGRLGMDTDYYLDGTPVVKFEKIEFSAWGESEIPTERLFSEYIVPHFKGECTAFSPACRRTHLFYCHQTFQIGEVYFQVEATEPAGLGVVTDKTDIFAVWDQTPEFDKVHIVPFQDTLPRAYNYDLFQDYLKPYLMANKPKKFAANELFCFHGVQFKLVAAEPQAPARITRRTTIYCEGTLHPSLGNLLPPELLSQVAQLPVGLRMLLLSNDRTSLEDMLTQRRGLFNETLEQIPRISWPPADARESSQQTCMICLGDFAIGDRCRKLPCRHIFHEDCVDEWLRRCTDCPICKDNVDRAIRGY